MINFLLGFHCHQPVGNFESVFQDINEKSYRPLLKTMSQFPDCKFCLHVSGILLEWWKKNDPGLIDIIADGVHKRSIELLGGGYYEPVLASIPYRDRISQLTMLNKALKKYFGVYPKGAWVTERIWQPDLITALSEAGLNYVFLDDFQFFQAGIGKDEIDSIFMTEYNGIYLDVFPIHERLRYKLPFANPEESVHEVRYMGENLPVLSVMVDDGEKMGGWPGTYEWVYGKDGQPGWLFKFLMLMEDRSNNIRMELPSKLLHIIKERKPVYLPFSSYREMGEWTLPVSKRLKYNAVKDKSPDAPLCGGIWHNFLIRYPEANLMHKRMLYISKRLEKLTGAQNYKRAELELLKSQANDAYWHGVFGGIYLPHLRRALQKAMIASSVYIDKIVKIKGGGIIEKTDFDIDGEEEYQLRNNFWQILYKPSTMALLAWDYLKPGFQHALGDLFCLHDEYDIEILKKKINVEKNIQGVNNEENIPHTIHNEVELPSRLSEKILKTYKRLLPSFQMLWNEKPLNYSLKSVRKRKKNLIISSSGFLDEGAVVSMDLFISKTLNYFFKLESKNAGRLDIFFRFCLPGGAGPSTYIKIDNLDVFGLSDEIPDKWIEKEIIIADSYWGSYLTCLIGPMILSPSFGYIPVNTVSLSESGYEKIFQGGEIKLSWDIKEAGIYKIDLSWQIKQFKMGGGR